ncbi:hypothetical protein A3F37_01135 [Candidatus Saccharibacteria bacterium RIFCSPHIGHO2_12_FULL_41_12]|nr:MAG: hypothetical protein A3F37_01135 [Candidatus Saccharibacteria bacterium RIFCSPHIGHO2_12_FULL_41_12]
MAEILHALSSNGSWAYQPMRELGSESQREVRELVGSHLIATIDDGKEVKPGAFLVELESGKQVAFEYNVAIPREKIKAGTEVKSLTD